MSSNITQRWSVLYSISDILICHFPNRWLFTKKDGRIIQSSLYIKHKPQFWPLSIWDYSFTTYANFPERLTHTHVSLSRVRNKSFPVNFAYILNEWSLFTKDSSQMFDRVFDKPLVSSSLFRKNIFNGCL